MRRFFDTTQLSSSWQYTLHFVLVVIVYLALAFLSGQIINFNTQVVTVWLPAGLMLGVVLVGGYRYVPASGLGVVLIGLLRSQPISIMLLIAVINMLTLIVATYLIRNILRTNLHLKKARDVVELVLVGGFGVTLLGALVGTGVVALSDGYTSEGLLEQFFVLWFGGSLAIPVITPIVLTWHNTNIPLSSPNRWVELILLLALTLVLSGIAFSGILPIETNVYTLYMILPSVIWAIIRFSLKVVTLINAMLVVVLLWVNQSGQGIFVGLPLMEHLFAIWSLIGIGTTCVLIIKITVEERNEIALTLRKERDAMTQILDNLGQAVTVIDKDGLYEYINPAFGRLIGRDDTESLVGISPYEVIADSFKPQLDQIFELRKQGAQSSYRAVLKHHDGSEVEVLTTGVPRIIDGKHQGSISVLTDMRPILEAQEAQRKSEAEFKNLFENTQVGMYRCTPDGTTIAVNQRLAESAGFESPQAFLDAFQDTSQQFYVDPNRSDEFRRQLHEHGKVTDFESETYVGNFDQTVWVQESAYAAYDESGEMLYYEGTVLDITARKRFEQELQRSENFFRAIFENSADGIVVVDTTSRIVMANRAQQALTGYSIQELTEMTVVGYVHPDDVDHEEDMFQHALKNHDDSYALELRIVRKNGGIRWVSASIGLVWNDKGEYEYAIGISRDVTEARQLRLQLQQDEQRFRAIFENASLPIAVTRSDRTIGMVNQALCDMLGYTEAQLVGKKFDTITYPGDNDENLALYQQLIDREIDSFTLTKRYIHQNGETVWATLSVSLFEASVLTDSDMSLHTIAIVENITERKLAQDRLLAEKQLNDQLIDALPGIFYFFDQDGNFLRWNKELENIRGFTSEQIASAHPLDFFQPEIKDSVAEAIQEVFETGYTVVELPVLNANGTTTLHLMNGYRMTFNDAPCLVGVGIDISGLKQAEIALRESEERHRSIFENALIGMYRTTDDGRFISANPAIAEMLGYDSVDELYQLDIPRDIYFESSDRRMHIEEGAKAEGDYSEHIIKLKKKDGEAIFVDIRERRYYDDGGTLLYYEGSMRDITEKHRFNEQIKRLNQDLARRIEEATRELRQKNQQLLELDRLRAKFIADMSHEMRTPLAVLNTRLYLLTKSQDNNDIQRHIGGLQMQIDRLTEFVENAFDLSVIDMSRNNITFDEVQLNTIVEKAIDALQPRADVAELTLTYQLEPDLPTIIGVDNHLSQVVTNLVGNAIKYTQEGAISVSTGRDSITNRVFIKVEDTGMGIAPEDKDYLFSRFYRGERAGQSTIPGTGLGLSIVKEIIDAHNGHIDVESEVDEGSIFVVWLPIE